LADDAIVICAALVRSADLVMFQDHMANSAGEHALGRVDSRGEHRLPGPITYLLLFSIVVAFLSLARGLLALAFLDRVEAVPGAGEMFWIGLRMDVVTASFLVAPVALALLALPGAWVGRAATGFALYFAVAMTVVVLMEAISFDFIEEYDNRPNRIFVEYLGGSKEVVGTLLGQYGGHLLAGASLAVAVFVSGWKLARGALRGSTQWGARRRAAFAVVIVPLLVLGTRGTLAHRPVNPSTAAFSGENLLNQLALNSTYSAAYAGYSMREDGAGPPPYGEMPEAEILARVAAYAPTGAAGEPRGEIPFLHVQQPGRRLARPRNLVILLEESLGAEFVGILGGLPLTPEFDALSREGLLLTRLYSTGTRTVRGIEATVAGFLPTPASAVVKRPRARTGFFTMAALLREHGYATDFIYGGQSHFDNMAAFLLGNGFERALDESDYEDPAFEGTWGVSDEDLMRRAHERFEAYGDQPFFALVLSTSNHSPSLRRRSTDLCMTACAQRRSNTWSGVRSSTGSRR
jgi:phosphoglycerol transferase MdoB-like AlkP superfamily enzyme